MNSIISQYTQFLRDATTQEQIDNLEKQIKRSFEGKIPEVLQTVISNQITILNSDKIAEESKPKRP